MSYLSKRHQALVVLQERLARITEANGFNTDAGDHVYVGETPQLGPDDEDEAIAVVLADDETGSQREHVVCTLPLSIVGICKYEGATPALAVEPLVSDIKRAIEDPTPADPTRDLGGILIRFGLARGSTGVVKREPGSQQVGGSVGYTLQFGEVWGAP